MDQWIWSDDQHAFVDCLGDKQPVERIMVEQRQFSFAPNMIIRQPQVMKSVPLDSVTNKDIR